MPSLAVPLADAQSGLWFAQRIDPGNPIYNTAQYIDLRGPLDVPALAAAVEQALREAEALSVRIEDLPDGPVQVHDPSRRATVQIVDCRRDSDPEAAAHRWMQRDSTTPVDVTSDLLIAEAVLILDDHRHFWYQRVHHVAIDGYGTALLTSRIADLYASALTGTPATTTPFAPYTPVIDQEAAYRVSATWDRDRAFWMSQFADQPDARSLGATAAMTTHTWHRHSVPLPAIVGERIVATAKAVDIPWPDVLVALGGAYVARHTGQSDVLIGVPAMNRLGTVAARVPAMVMNVLPVRLAIDETVPLTTWLEASSRTLRAARRHGRYRSEQLRRDLGRLSADRRLFGALVNVLPFDQRLTFPGLDAQVHVLSTGAVDDITMTVRSDDAGGGMRLEIDANPLVYSVDDVRAHADRLAAFLSASIGVPRLLDIPTLTNEEHQRFVIDLNATHHDVEPTTLAALIERQMARVPDRVAVRDAEGDWTYRDLSLASDALAHTLTTTGVARGDVVVVALPRSKDLIAACVSVLRAGAVYMPIDPDYPADRLAAMFATANPRCVITTDDLRDRFGDLPTIVVQPNLEPSRQGCRTEQPGFSPAITVGLQPDGSDNHRTVQPSDAAYLIYTSGSTGAPKGVLVEHRSIVNRLEWMRQHYGFTEEDRILHKTPVTFDVSVWELFLPLITGATLVVAPPDAHRDPAWLVRVIREHAITTVHFVPSILSALLSEPTAQGLAVRRVFASGEELPSSVRDRFHTVIQGELHNLYGPTEAAVDVTWWPATANDRSHPVPIGFPVWNTSVYVLDDHLRPVPPSVVGHLYLGGVQLAREYVGRPDLTEERFVPTAFGRLYKTGDLARLREDGAVVFMGRSDRQVKVRGVRIELDEIESALQRHRDVGESVVVVREDRPGDQRLVAYITPAATAGTIDVSSLQDALRRTLPDAHIPSTFIVLTELPLTAHGKLDRKALPAPSAFASSSGEPPRSATERWIAEVFADALGLPIESVMRSTDFFSEGGHSLLAARVMTRVRDEWPINIGLGALFAHPTVGALAQVIDERRDGLRVTSPDGLGPMIAIVAAEQSPQAPLFCIHPAGGIAWCYAGLGRGLGDPRPVYGIQARGLDPHAAMPASLDAMASMYVDDIRRRWPTGPYHLAGWSVGGIVAQAMAVRLEALGARVGVVALIDAYPCDRWRDQPPPDEDAALGAVMQMAGHDRGEIGAERLTRDALIRFLRRSGHPLAELSDETITGVVRVVAHNSQLVRTHRHDRYAGTVLHFRAAFDHQDEDLHPHQWAPYVDTLNVHDVPSLHAHLTSPAAVRHIAPILNAYLRRTEDTR